MTISEKIRATVTAVKPDLLKIPEHLAAKKPNPDSWSKKEILGHLIDSAANNHQRFVRAAQNLAMAFPTYEQNRWVEVQSYNNMNWTDLIEFFFQYNMHISRVLEFLPQQALQNLCNFGKEHPVALDFVIQDYLRHLEHHLEQLNRPIT